MKAATDPPNRDEQRQDEHGGKHARGHQLPSGVHSMSPYRVPLLVTSMELNSGAIPVEL